MSLYKKFTRSLNILLPAKEALNFLPDYYALTEINVLAGKHFRDSRMSMKDVPPKLRVLADEFLDSKGIDVKVAPISILDEDFEKEVGKHKRSRTKAAEIEHAIRHHLDVDMDDDPDLQASFAEALAAIFKEFKDNWQKIYEELEKLREKIRSASKEETYGLHRKKQMPFYRMFRRELEEVLDTAPGYGDDKDERISLLVDLTQQVYNTVERELKLTGFWTNIPARNRMKADLQKIFLRPKFSKAGDLIRRRAHLISRVIEIAEKNNDAILYSE